MSEVVINCIVDSQSELVDILLRGHLMGMQFPKNLKYFLKPPSQKIVAINCKSAVGMDGQIQLEGCEKFDDAGSLLGLLFMMQMHCTYIYIT